MAVSSSASADHDGVPSSRRTPRSSSRCDCAASGRSDIRAVSAALLRAIIRILGPGMRRAAATAASACPHASCASPAVASTSARMPSTCTSKKLSAFSPRSPSALLACSCAWLTSALASAVPARRIWPNASRTVGRSGCNASTSRVMSSLSSRRPSPAAAWASDNLAQTSPALSPPSTAMANASRTRRSCRAPMSSPGAARSM